MDPSLDELASQYTNTKKSGFQPTRPPHGLNRFFVTQLPQAIDPPLVFLLRTCLLPGQQPHLRSKGLREIAVLQSMPRLADIRTEVAGTVLS